MLLKLVVVIRNVVADSIVNFHAVVAKGNLHVQNTCQSMAQEKETQTLIEGAERPEGNQGPKPSPEGLRQRQPGQD
jgi:hypothetical protein